VTVTKPTADPTASASTPTPTPTWTDRARRLVCSPVGAGFVLLLAYVLLSLLNDPHAFLGTDTGGKVATLATMSARHSLHPDVGYWAARWDPTGRVHPLWYTSRYGGQWLQLSTLPMTYLALPLYHLGGYRLILLIPMLGGVATAYVARGLARRVRPAGDGWWAFWLVGLASPIAIYALDFWEHTLGVACMAGAVLALLNVLDAIPADERVRWRRLAVWSIVTGLLYGAAATMRTEAFVYAVAGVGVVCVVVLWRRRVVAAFAVGAFAVMAAAVPFIGNVLLERWALGSAVRATREQSTASAPGFGGLAARGKEAVIMFTSLNPAVDTMAMVIGVALVALLVYVVLRSSGRDQRPAKIAAGAVVALYVTRAAAGLGFVPGLVAATPIAAVGLALAVRRFSGRVVVMIAVVALPVVWLFDALGGVAPQWAGRYILTTGTLLMAVGVAFLPEVRRWVRRFFVGLAICVTVFGLAWMSMRTHQMAHAQDQLAARPEPVLVSGIAHLVREGGAHYLDHKWLTAQGQADQQFAANVVKKAGYDEFGLVRLAPSQPGPVPTFDGWRAVQRQKMSLLAGVDLQIVTYQRA
jgi:hypothetical protein